MSDRASSPALVQRDLDRGCVGRIVGEIDLEFEQDTSNPEYKQAREYRDELYPQLTELAVDFQRKLLAGDVRERMLAQDGIFLRKPFAPQALLRAVEDSLVKEPV